MKRVCSLLFCIVLMLSLTACGKQQSKISGISIENINAVWGDTVEEVAKAYNISLDSASYTEIDQNFSIEMNYSFEGLKVEGCQAIVNLYFRKNADEDAGLYLMQFTFESAKDMQSILEKLQALPDYVQMKGGNGYFGIDTIQEEDFDWLEQNTNIRKGEQGFLTEQGRYDPETGRFSGNGSYVGEEYPLITLRANAESCTIQLSNGITYLLKHH